VETRSLRAYAFVSESGGDTNRAAAGRSDLAALVKPDHSETPREKRIRKLHIRKRKYSPIGAEGWDPIDHVAN